MVLCVGTIGKCRACDCFSFHTFIIGCNTLFKLKSDLKQIEYETTRKIKLYSFKCIQIICNQLARVAEKETERL